MKTKPFYLVIGTGSRTARRTTQRWPTLDPGEIVVRLTLTIPDSLIASATVIELEVDEPDAIGITAEPVELPLEEEA